MSNRELYEQGRRARMNRRAGPAVIIFYFLLAIFVLALSYNSWMAKEYSWAIGGFLVAMVFFYLAFSSIKTLINADAEYFDYQKKSGLIVHRGEGW